MALGALLFASASSKAQSTKTGDINISAGYGILNLMVTEDYHNGPFYIRGEYKVSKRIGLGLDYATYTVSSPYSNYGTDLSQTYRSYGLKMYVHLGKKKKVDPYFTFGAALQSPSEEDYQFQQPENTYKFMPLATFGERFYLNRSLAFFYEVGMDRSVITLGLNFCIRPALKRIDL